MVESNKKYDPFAGLKSALRLTIAIFIGVPLTLVFCIAMAFAFYGMLIQIGTPLSIPFSARWGAVISLILMVPIIGYCKESKSLFSRLLLCICFLSFLILGNEPWYVDQPGAHYFKLWK